MRSCYVCCCYSEQSRQRCQASEEGRDATDDDERKEAVVDLLIDLLSRVTSSANPSKPFLPLGANADGGLGVKQGRVGELWITGNCDSCAISGARDSSLTLRIKDVAILCVRKRSMSSTGSTLRGSGSAGEMGGSWKAHTGNSCAGPCAISYARGSSLTLRTRALPRRVGRCVSQLWKTGN